MTISITLQLEEFIKEQVAAGRYASSSEVIRAGLRLLQDLEAEKAQRYAALKQWVQEGVDDSVVVDAATVRARALKTIKEVSQGPTINLTVTGAD